jgi:agmatinase
MFNAIQENLISPNNTISIGIRSPADKISREFLSVNGGKTISATRALKWSPLSMHEIIKSTVGTNPVYLSLDIDCLDPAYAPGTGTPEIGGLSTVWLRELLDLCNDINFIGMDCVEVAPPYDHSEITSLAAATFCWQYLSMIAYKNEH